MLRKLLRIPSQAWILLCSTGFVAVITVVIRTTEIVQPKTFMYIVQPLLACLLAGIAFIFARGRQNRIRHKGEKMTIVASVLSVWFVLYFLSGLALTYVHNTLTSEFVVIALNVMTFGVTAAAMTYTLYITMQLVSRRDVLWFGVIVAIVFSLQEMSFTQLSELTRFEDIVKLSVSEFIPTIFSSFLLTYLAISCGLGAMMVYKLGLAAIIVLPPIIPKYDWYLIGVSSILLTISIYIAIDRTAQSREPGHTFHYRHARRAYDVMLLLVTFGLVLFMTGFFTYKPSVIVSNSMQPLFSRGSLVIMQPISSPMDIRKGDIVQYESTGKVITHRVVNIDTTTDGSGKRVFITKGDNSPSEDKPVQANQVLGIVRSHVPYIGYPTVFLKELKL